MAQWKTSLQRLHYNKTPPLNANMGLKINRSMYSCLCIRKYSSQVTSKVYPPRYGRPAVLNIIVDLFPVSALGRCTCTCMVIQTGVPVAVLPHLEASPIEGNILHADLHLGSNYKLSLWHLFFPVAWLETMHYESCFKSLRTDQSPRDGMPMYFYMFALGFAMYYTTSDTFFSPCWFTLARKGYDADSPHARSEEQKIISFS